MRYWDSSAIVPLLVSEKRTGAMEKLLRVDADMVTWWGSGIECVSALSRVERLDPSCAPAVEEALRRLDALGRAWHEVQPTSVVHEVARRLLRVHAIRAADALQLAAAIVAAENRPPTLELVCLDERLADAARREGFPVRG